MKIELEHKKLFIDGVDVAGNVIRVETPDYDGAEYGYPEITITFVPDELVLR